MIDPDDDSNLILLEEGDNQFPINNVKEGTSSENTQQKEIEINEEENAHVSKEKGKKRSLNHPIWNFFTVVCLFNI